MSENLEIRQYFCDFLPCLSLPVLRINYSRFNWWSNKCDDYKINAVGSICILDDDSGFAWGILTPYVVLTRVALNDEEYQKKRDKFPKDEFYFVDKYDYGISEENVQQAIDILNNNPYLEKRKSDVNWKNNF